MFKKKYDIEDSQKNKQRVIEDTHDVQNQRAVQLDGSAGLALIDPRHLTRMSLLHLLTALSPGNRRSGDFMILPYADPNEFVTDYLEHSWRVGMIVFNIGLPVFVNRIFIMQFYV